eukprot:6034121-Pyramimonas_sp.AAC.1
MPPRVCCLDTAALAGRACALAMEALQPRAPSSPPASPTAATFSCASSLAPGRSVSHRSRPLRAPA